MNFVPASQRVEVSNLMGLVFLEGSLAQPKSVAGVSSDDTKGSWEVWGKTDSWFPSQKNKSRFKQELTEKNNQKQARFKQEKPRKSIIKYLGFLSEK